MRTGVSVLFPALWCHLMDTLPPRSGAVHTVEQMHKGGYHGHAKDECHGSEHSRPRPGLAGLSVAAAAWAGGTPRVISKADGIDFAMGSGIPIDSG